MSLPSARNALGGALAILAVLLMPGSAAAQGSVTPSFGSGSLVLLGEAYRPGERVELVVRAAGARHAFAAIADARGRFRYDTGLTPPPLSSLEIEATDEQGLAQATIASVPGGLPSVPDAEDRTGLDCAS